MPLITDVTIDGHHYLYVQDREGTNCGSSSPGKYNGGCRCDACRDKWAAYKRESRRKAKKAEKR